MRNVTVVVPVYGVEDYIERCYKTLMRQTLQDFEIIFVIDGAKDRSEERLLSALEMQTRHDVAVTIIRHPVNQGIAAARQTGTDAATGEYIFFLDADDFIPATALGKLYATAQRDDADIVYSDYYEEHEDIFDFVSQAPHRGEACTPHALLKAMLEQRVRWTPWGKLIRHALFEGIVWPLDLQVAEDLVVIPKVVMKATRVAYVEEALYVYNRTNTGSLIAGMKASGCMQTQTAVQNLHEHFAGQRNAAALSSLLHTKLFVKYLFLYSQNNTLITSAHRIFPEAVSVLDQYTLAPRPGKMLMKALHWPQPAVLRTVWAGAWISSRYAKNAANTVKRNVAALMARKGGTAAPGLPDDLQMAEDVDTRIAT